MNKRLIYILNIKVNYDVMTNGYETYMDMNGLTIGYAYKNITALLDIKTNDILNEDEIKERIIKENS